MKLLQVLLGIFLLLTTGGTEESHRITRNSNYPGYSNPQSNQRGPPQGQPQYQVAAAQPQQQFMAPPGQVPGQYPPPNGQPQLQIQQQQQGQQQIANPNSRQMPAMPPGIRWPPDGQNMRPIPGSAPQDQPNGLVQQPQNQEVLDGVYRLSEEIVEAVVERLEEDEAMAIEMERQGFDPDLSSSSPYTKPTLLLIVNLTIMLALHM